MTASRSLLNHLADLQDVDLSGLATTGDGLVWDATAGKIVSVTGQIINVRHPRYGARGDGVTDDTVAIRSALADATLGGIVFFPPGTYKVTSSITVPSGVTLGGCGWGSKILIAGVDPLNSGTNYNAFNLSDGTTDVRITGLRFSGQNNPFVQPASKGQSAIVNVAGTLCADVQIDNCVFEYTYGFGVHVAGSGTRIHTFDCLFRYVASGLNNNANYSIQSRNRLYNSWAIESGGSFNIFEGNTLISCTSIVSMSIGGDQNPTRITPGCVVRGNMIDSSAGGGIILADGIVDCIVEGNTIRRTATYGILVNSGAGTTPRNIAIVSNIISSCGLTANVGIGISITKGSGYNIVGNRVFDDGQTGYAQKFGLQFPTGSAVSGVTVVGNYFGNTLKDLSFNNTTNIRFSGNRYTAALYETIGTCTFLADSKADYLGQANAWTSKQTFSGGVLIPTSAAANKVLLSDASGNGTWATLDVSIAGAGTLAAARGGTGVDGSAAASGAMLIGNGAGFTLAQLTAGANITITPGAGSVTISATGASAPAGGSNTQLQWNNGGALDGAASVTVHGGDLVLTTQTDPVSSADGELFNGTQKTLAGKFNGTVTPFVGTLFTQTASVTVDANIVGTTETTLVGAGVGTTTLPANFFVVGKTLRITAYGTNNTPGASVPNMRLKLKFGTTVILDDNGATNNANLVNRGWEFRCYITCRSTGVGGTVFAQGLESRSTTSTVAAIVLDLENTAPATVDTTASQAIALTCTYTNSVSGNTLICTNFTIEVLN